MAIAFSASETRAQINQTKWLYVSLVAAAFAVLPIFAFIFFKVSSALNWDEWDMVGLVTVQQLERGLDFLSLWSPHNEHRVFLLRLLAYFNSMLDLSTVRLMFLSVSIFFICYLILFKSFLKAHLRLGRLNQVFLLIAPFIFFNWVQKENYFWGVQVIWATSLLGFIICALGLVRKSFLLFAIGMLLGLISLSTWIALVGFVIIYFANEIVFSEPSQLKQYLRAASHIFFALILFVLYMRGLKTEATHLTYDFSIFKFLVFFVDCLGLWTQELGRSFNFIFGLLFLGFTLWLWQKKIWRVCPVEFYLMLLAACISGLIAIGRSQDWQMGDHIHGRYSSLTLPGVVAALSLFFRLCKNKSVLVIGLIFLCVMTVITTVKSFEHELGIQTRLESEQRCIGQHLKEGRAILKNETECYQTTYPDPARLWMIAQDLSSRGLYPFKEAH